MKRTSAKREILLDAFSATQEPLRENFLEPANNHQLLQYFQEVRKKFLYSTNLGLALDDNDFDATGKPVLLNNLFVPPLLSSKQLSPDEIIRTEQETNKLSLQEVYQALREKPRLFILGTPGTGKTTLIHWLMLALTYSGDNHVKGALGNVVPFALILRDLCVQGINTWAELWRVYLERSGTVIDQQLIDSLVKTGQALFLIDGLDEISDSSLRAGLGKALLDGMNRHNRCRFVITSRIVGFSPAEFFNLRLTEPLPDDRLTVLEEHKEISDKYFIVTESKLHDSLALTYLAPFKTSQVKRFVVNWYGQYEPNTAIHAQRVDDLVTRVEKNDGLGQLSRIPVLLNMICFIHARRARLPDGRAELYERIAQTYLVSLDRARGLGFQREDISVDYQDLSNWLATLALSMQERRGSKEGTVYASRSEVEAILLQGLEEKGTFHSKCDEQCRFILDYIVKRSGFLVPVGRKDEEDVYAFNHLSFQEYFAARALDEKISFITKASEWNAIRKHLHESHWLETFILFFEIQPSVKRTDHLVTLLFGKDLQHLKKKVKKKDSSQADIPLCWLLDAHIAMDTAVRLGREMRDRLIDEGWQAVLPFIANENVKQGGLMVQRRQACSNQMAAILFQDQFDSLKTFKKVFADQKILSLVSSLIRDTSSLSSLTNLQWLELNSTAVSDISGLSNLTNLTSLMLSNTQVSDINRLVNLKNLGRLDLSYTAVSDVSSLADLPNLTSLDLSNTAVSDVSSLADVTNLTSLNLSDTQVNDVSRLANLTKLRWLDLSSTQVSNVSSLANLTNLIGLCLATTPLNDVSSLSNLTNLQSLFLYETLVSDVSSLSHLVNLTDLYLSKTSVGDASSLSSLINLERLYLSSTAVSDISSLAYLTNLQELSLFNTQVNDVSSLSSLTNIKKLDLDSTAVSDVSSLAHLTNLQELSLSYTQVNDVSSLSRLTNLRELYLRNTPVSDISSLSHLKNLKIWK